MKLSIYNKIVEVDDGFVIYNTNVSKYYKINKEKDVEEFKEILNKKTISEKTLLVEDLFNKDFIVDDRKNEYKIVNKQINKYYKELNKQLRMLIYTTNQCNFRCIYCPEKHENVKLSQDNWDSLYKYIEKNVKSKKFESVILGFFGGEPLLEAKAMIEFLKKISKLKKYNSKLFLDHTITTNGYLLTPKIYDELVKYGLKQYQLTIDGFAKSHDVTRPRVDGKGTWDKIIENLEYIDKQNDGALITIRVNVSKFNQDSVIEFFNWFDEKFKNQKFNYDIIPVSKFSDEVDDKYIIERNSAVMDNLSDCLYKFRKFGSYSNNPVSVLSHTCKCAQSNFYTLAADTKIYKCEKTYAEAKPVGYLGKNGNIVFTDDIKPWTKGFECEKCKTCYLYPICAGRTCPSKKVMSKPGERIDCECEIEYADHQITEIIKSGNYSPDDVYEHDEEKQKLQKENKKTIYRRKLKYSGDNVDEFAINDFITINKDSLTKANITKIKKAFEEYKKDNKIDTLFNALGDSLADKFKTHFYSTQFEKKDLSILFKLPFTYGKVKDKDKIEKCLKIFDNVFAKNEYKQDKLRLSLLKKIRKLIADGKLEFKNVFTEKKAEYLFSLRTGLLNEIISNGLDYLSYYSKFYTQNNIHSKKIASILAAKNFLTKRQYSKLSDCSKMDSKSKDDIIKIEKQIIPMLSERQKFVLKNKSVKTFDLAEAYIKRGSYSPYSYMNIRKTVDDLYKIFHNDFLSKEQINQLGDYRSLDYKNKKDVQKFTKLLKEVMVEEQLNLLTIQRIPLEVYAEKLIEKGCFRYSDTDPKERVSWRRYYTLERLVVGKTSIDNKQIEMSDLIKPVEYKGSNSEKNIFKRAFAKIKVADINVDHNQALFVLEKAFENSVSPKIVVNFDTHSDMYIRCGKKNTIANWVNFTFSHKDIDKCYWVVPKKIIQDNPYAAYNYFFAAYNESGAVIGNYDYTKICAPGEMYSQKFYYEYKNNCLTPIIDKKPKGRVKEVELVVCTEDNLPKFKDNDEIFLSVDGDYFCNCGRDTVAQFLNFPYDINESFKSFGKIIEKCNIKPNSFSMSISPDYTSIFGSREVYGYFKYLLSFTSQKWIPIKEYKFDNKPSCLKDSSKSECDNEQDDLLDMI